MSYQISHAAISSSLYYILDGNEFRKQYATLNDRRGSLRAKPSWLSDLTTPYEGFAEGPPRALGNAIPGVGGYRTPVQVEAA